MPPPQTAAPVSNKTRPHRLQHLLHLPPPRLLLHKRRRPVGVCHRHHARRVALDCLQHLGKLVEVLLGGGEDLVAALLALLIGDAQEVPGGWGGWVWGWGLGLV